MAFRDANGVITIDDEAAAADVRNLTAAIEHFDIVLSMINQMETMTAGFKGNSLTALTVDTINHVVEKYHAIDRQLKDLINGQQN